MKDEVTSDETPNIPSDLPKDVKLEDDTRLNQISFIDKHANSLPNLPPLGQALLIAQA